MSCTGFGGVETHCTWLDKTPLGFTNWDKNEPKNPGQTRVDCVITAQSFEGDGFWEPWACTGPAKNVVCKMPEDRLLQNGGED